MIQKWYILEYIVLLEKYIFFQGIMSKWNITECFILLKNIDIFSQCKI